MTVRRNQPARNPREGVLQNLKKEKKESLGGALRVLNRVAKHKCFSQKQSSLLKSIYFPVDQSQ